MVVRYIVLMAGLQRYISDELTHLVGRSMLNDLEQQYQTLLKIMSTGKLTPPPHLGTADFSGFGFGPHGSISKNQMFVPQVVCFCDIPTEDLRFHSLKYGRFGLSFKKAFLSAKGANPVFYIAGNSITYGPRDITDRGVTRPELFEATLKKGTRSEHFDDVVRAEWDVQGQLWQEIGSQFGGCPSDTLEQVRIRQNHIARFLMHQVYVFMKFFDETKGEDDPENYYMEREWRINGNLGFAVTDIARVILPEEYATRFRADVPKFCNQLTFL